MGRFGSLDLSWVKVRVRVPQTVEWCQVLKEKAKVKQGLQFGVLLNCPFVKNCHVRLVFLLAGAG